MSRSTCQYPGCRKESIYWQSWGYGPARQNGFVCGEHDKACGAVNMMNAFGLTMEEAKEMNLRLDREAKA